VPTNVEKFCAEHFTLESISDRRQLQVRTALARYEKFLSKPPEQADASELRAWLTSLRESGLAASTVGWHLKMVKPFHRWCWQQRITSADEYLRLREVRPPRGSDQAAPRPYTRRELDRMFTELEAKFPYASELMLVRWRNGTSKFHGSLRRHAMRVQLEAMIELALVCGLRRVEIYRLSIADCHPDNKYIVVHGKRKDHRPKVREVPYSDSTRRAIAAWFKVRTLMEPAPGIGLWLSVTGPQPAVALSWGRMTEIMRSFGEWEFHRLRHTCATERLRAGMAVVHLQQFLGHSDIAMTLRYAKLVASDIHTASERTDAAFQAAIGRAA
jgi:site-specific recombinase XerD